MTYPETIKVNFTNVPGDDGKPISVHIPYPTPELINKLTEDKSLPKEILLFKQALYLKILAEDLALAKGHK